MNATRRQFLEHLGLGAMTALTLGRSALSAQPAVSDAFSAERVKAIVTKAKQQHWDTLPIGDVVARVGRELIGTPYVGGTLEGTGPEQCRFTLSGLDCVTFFESCLAIALGCKNGNEVSIETIERSIQHTRYRGGVLDGYCSRLHYTAEWLSDNETKGVVRDITRELSGAVPFALHVDFMSTHPQFYPALKENPALVKTMQGIEQRINATKHWIVPKDNVSAIEQYLQNGDIVAIATSKAGLDYAHTGLIAVSEDGVRHFLHASSAKKQVTFDSSISSYLQTVSSDTGISIARPLEAK